MLTVNIDRPDRRSLEMRRRSSRLRATREGEGTGSSLEHVFHMVRSVKKQGFNFEDYYCSYGDTALKGRLS